MTNVDPYGGQFVTAGDPAVDVDGVGIESHRASDPNGVSAYYGTYGTLAPQVWAEDQNRIKLASGAAIITPNGLISATAALSAIQSRGYKGATDAASVAQSYALLMSPAPSTATAAPAAGGLSFGAGSITLPGVGQVPTLAAVGVAVVGLYLLMGGGRRR